MDRAEHLAWCKQRAHEYLDVGDVANAIASMMSDLGKHPETEGVGKNPALVMFGMMAAQNNSREDARRYIDGFN